MSATIKVITPTDPSPGLPHANDPYPIVFLAGSIEMGAAEEWQKRLIAELEDAEVTCTILNPRRNDWDSSWVQSKDNPQFRHQVEWELNGLEDASIIAMYLAPGTVSPISLLELGLHADENVLLCCPLGFARKGNVDIVANRRGIPVYETWSEWVDALVRDIRGD